MAFGDIHVRNDGLYTHYAFEGPSGRTIEYTKRYGTPSVMMTLARDVGATAIISYPANAPYTKEQAWNRLCTRLGERRYSATDNNCEGLVNWGIFGTNASPQGSELRTAIQVAVGVLAVAAVVKLLAR